METGYLKKIIADGENTSVEFKRSQTRMNSNIFETVCAFLNRSGGHLFLGVEDNGSICGVNETAVEGIVSSFVTTANNPQKLFPPFYFSPEVAEIDGKKVVHIFVPESSQVHQTAGRIFDRNDDGDFDVTANPSHISQLYLRKQATYSENTIYPYATLDDLRPDLIKRAKIQASNKYQGSHPWSQMDTLEMLTSAQLYKRDRNTGKEGLTLAALLLFGTEEAILSVVPHHRTDALLRVQNLNRYDDRDDIRVNLIESYDRLMAFVVKHLPDPFYQEESGRVSLRNKIFREAVSNLLIHREFTHAYPAKMIIEKHRVVFENANRPHGHGMIDPNAFTPFPKNPVIARVFKEIGLADELGSGVRNIYHYSPIYSHGGQPRFYEDDIFKVMLPLTDQATDQVSDQATDQVSDQAGISLRGTEQDMLQYCQTARTMQEIMDYLGFRHKPHFRNAVLHPMLKSGKLKMTIPDKPSSPKQKYYTAHTQGEDQHE